MNKIAFIFALKHELQPVLRRFPAAVPTRIDNLPAWQFTVKSDKKPFSTLTGKGPVQCIIAESGIGMANASHATIAVIESFKPDMIISIGFCGALRTGITTGDLVLAEQLFIHKNGSLKPQTGLKLSDERAILPQTAKLKLFSGTFITTETMVSKENIIPLLDETMQTPVLEMESSAVSRICINAGIRFAAIRSVSDPAEEDPFLLAYDIIGPDFRIDRKRALVALLKKPGHLPQLLRLMRNSRLAGNSLAGAVSNLLESISCN
jgi:adenosylhomocysteine nucleosidase